MSTIADQQYSSPGNINLKRGIMRFDVQKSSNPLTNDSLGRGLYVNDSDELVFWNGSTADVVSSDFSEVIAGVASGTPSLTLTEGDILVSDGDIEVTDGDLTFTANASSIIFTGTGANGGVVSNMKNAAASSLSGTQLDVEIDIGGTPYHFTVYPTKA